MSQCQPRNSVLLAPLPCVCVVLLTALAPPEDSHLSERSWYELCVVSVPHLLEGGASQKDLQKEASSQSSQKQALVWKTCVCASLSLW